jgi:predicted flavoprotein YhiN
VPLTLSGEDALFRTLSGVATPTRVHHGKICFEEASLFTHKGLSGPAILQISSYWRPGDVIEVDFLPDLDAPALLRDAKRSAPRLTLRGLLARQLPARLAEALADRLALDPPLADLPDKSLIAAGAQLARWRFRPTGSEGFTGGLALAHI